MKKKKESRRYLFPWIVLAGTHFIFFLLGEFSVYLYIFQQFFAMCKYFSYIYLLILMTQLVIDRRNRRNDPEYAAKKQKKKKKGSRVPIMPAAAQPDASVAAPAEAEETPVKGKKKKRRMSDATFTKIVTVAHLVCLAFLLIQLNSEQFSRFHRGSIANSGGYGLFCIATCLIGGAAFVVADRILKGLPRKPGSGTAHGMLITGALVFAVSAVFLTINFTLGAQVLVAWIWVVRAMLIAFTLLTAAGAAVSLIKKDLLTDYDYYSFLTLVKKDGKKQNLADLLEEYTGLSVKSLWSIRYALSLLPPAVLALGAAVLLATCFYKVDPQQQAVVYRFGKIVSDEPVGSGLHLKLPWPVEKAELYDVARVKELLVGYEKQQSADNLWTQNHGGEEYQLLLGNGNELVSVNIKIAYVIDDLFGYVTGYTDPESMLTAKAYELILQKTISTDLDTFLSVDRSGLSEEMTKDLNAFCAESGIGLRVNGVTLESIHPPIGIADVYQSVVSAGVQKTTLITNAESSREEKIAAAEQEANTLVTAARQSQTTRVADARSEIDVFLAAAESYRSHPDAVTLAKYLDTFETVVSSNKVYVFIGDHNASDFLVNFGGKATVIADTDTIIPAAEPAPAANADAVPAAQASADGSADGSAAQQAAPAEDAGTPAAQG